MKLVPTTRPVTIEAVRYGERWFPLIFRLTSGNLLLSMAYNIDHHFSPSFSMTSFDEGVTWGDRSDHVPRIAWGHSFADGEFFQIDTYGIHDPNTESDCVYWAARSFPDTPREPARKGYAHVHCPSLRKTPLSAMSGFPLWQWSSIWNDLYGRDDMSTDEIHIGGPNFTDGVELPDGRLLAVGYGVHASADAAKDCVWLYESGDRGQTWCEVSLITDPAPGAFRGNEATLVRLVDGRLYCVMRTDDETPDGDAVLTHAWSADVGRSWTTPVPLRLIDSDHVPAHVWPMAEVLEDGTLVLVYGRPGKDMIFDPSGTGEQWQGRLDLHQWELETQAIHGVPEEKRLRGVGPDIKVALNKHTDSGDYLGVVAVGPRQMLVVYDAQSYVEHWNALPHSVIRMVRVELID